MVPNLRVPTLNNGKTLFFENREDHAAIPIIPGSRESIRRPFRL